MIILITGASRTGKTKLSHSLLEKCQYSFLSLERLKMGLIRSGHSHLETKNDDDLTAHLWQIVREIIKTAIKNSHDLIIEGRYIPADWKSDFSAEMLDSIRFVCLALTDSVIDSRFGKTDDSDFTAQSLKDENRKYIERFKENVVLIDSDFESALEAVALKISH